MPLLYNHLTGAPLRLDEVVDRDLNDSVNGTLGASHLQATVLLLP